MVDTHRWSSGITALIGAWVVVSAFAFSLSGLVDGEHFWNLLVAGAAILALGRYDLERAGGETDAAWTAGLAALTGLCGLWLAATPLVYGAAVATAASSVASGAAVALLSASRGLAGVDAGGDLLAEAVPS